MRQALSPLDIATGTMLGSSPGPERLLDPGISPREALEREILPALLRPPCLVSFSGGRDSSAVLAVATALARREGLDLPIPATNVFPGAIHAEETRWQRTVVSHLRLDDWWRFVHHEELDVVGPYAQRVMTTYGLLIPFNVHFHLPLLDAARGGSLLTGAGGDELFGATRRPRSVLDGGLRGVPRGLARTGLSFAPKPLRQAVVAVREPLPMPWLRPAALRSLSAAAARLAVDVPRPLEQRLAWWRRLRHLGEGKLGLALVAADADALLVHPLLSPAVWAAAGDGAGPRGFANRTDGMTRLFGDLLPAEIVGRPTKAHFDEAMWTDTARRFARDWAGTGVPEECVDPEALRRHWTGEQPSAHSFTLLQAAWIARAANRLEEKLDAVLV